MTNTIRDKIRKIIEDVLKKQHIHDIEFQGLVNVIVQTKDLEIDEVRNAEKQILEKISKEKITNCGIYVNPHETDKLLSK